MAFLNSADSIFLGGVQVRGIYVGHTRVWPPAQGPQPVVTNVSAGGTLTVSWAAVENAESYELRRNGVLISTQAHRTYNDSGLSWGSSHSYTIIPIVFGVPGDESLPSPTVTIPTPKGVTPTVSNVSSAGTLTVSWADVPFAGTYQLRRNGVLIATQSSRVYNDSGLGWGSSYSYTISVVNAANSESAPSSAVTIPRGTVGTLTPSSRSYTNVTISWGAVAGATEYRVYRNGALYSTQTALSKAIATSADTTISIYVVPVRSGVTGYASATKHYYSGRAEQRDQGSKTGMVFSPSRIDSWRPVDDWAWLSGIAAQGYWTASYGNYKGVIYYGSYGVRTSLRSKLGGDGTSRQKYGSCTKAELYLYKKYGVGTHGSVTTAIRRSNSTASGGEPSGSSAVTKTTASGGNGSWINIGTGHGQALGDGDYKSLMLRNDGSADYAQFTDCRLRLSWSWNYVTVTAKANTWS